MNIDLADFIGMYPDISDTNISQRLYHKKEFNELQLTNDTDEQIGLKKHQRLISRILSPVTMYDEMFLYHLMGTGKTCSAIAIAERALTTANSGIKRVLVLVNNDDLVKTFKDNAVYVCTDKKYLYQLEEKKDVFDTEKAKNDHIKRQSYKLLRKFYNVTTYQKFFNQVLSKTPDDVLSRRYSNYVVILDEVHHLASSSLYDAYFNFLHSLSNRKIVLLSGTPMMNEPSEIAPLMNLILPLNAQLNVKQAFNEYMNMENSIPTGPNDIGKHYLSEAFRGRVSYLAEDQGIPSRYIGEIIEPINAFNLYPSRMSDHQYNSYKAISSTESGFATLTQEASLFVFPDGSTSTAGYNKYVKKTKYWYRAKFIEDIRGLSYAAKLDKIGQWSAKYATIIESILENPDKNTFIYSESITGSGAIVLGLLLQLFGYSHASNGTLSGPARRFSILSSETIPNKISKVIGAFNRSTNSNGDYIHVLIGGRQVAEGFTFKNVQKIHIATPHWNFPTIDQAIARGIRIGAHRDLPVGTIVDIYLHVSAYPNVVYTDLIDLYMYYVSSKKDQSIKQIEYLLKTNAIDCSLTYQRNLQLDVDNSRKCQYNPCQYTCSGEYLDLPFDYTTYDINYTTEYETRVEDDLKTLFRRIFKISYTDLFAILDNYTQYEILRVLNDMEQFNTPMITKYEQIAYIRHDTFHVYLTSSIYDNGRNSSTSFYIENPFKLPDVSIVDELILQSDIRSLSHMMSLQTIDEKYRVLSSLDVHMQNTFIEMLPELKESYPDSVEIEYLFDQYKKYFVFKDDTIYHTFLMENDDGNMRMLVSGNDWVDVNARDVNKNVDVIMNKWGLYGKISGKKRVFKIVDVRHMSTDEKMNTTRPLGQVCSTMSFEKLYDIILHLNIHVDTAIDIDDAKNRLDIRRYRYDGLADEQIRTLGYFDKRSQVCRALQDWFTKNGLME